MAGFPQLDGHRIRDLQYADDVLLIETSAAGLQHLVNTAADICRQVGMEISLEKSVTMCVGLCTLHSLPSLAMELC